MVSLPSLQLPTYKWRSTGPGRSCCLLSITGLAALDGQYHSLSGTYFSASSRVTCLLPATQAGRHAGPKVYIWNVFGSLTSAEILYCPRSYAMHRFSDFLCCYVLWSWYTYGIIMAWWGGAPNFSLQLRSISHPPVHLPPPPPRHPTGSR
jgi:hypothetical protein